MVTAVVFVLGLLVVLLYFTDNQVPSMVLLLAMLVGFWLVSQHSSMHDDSAIKDVVIVDMGAASLQPHDDGRGIMVAALTPTLRNLSAHRVIGGSGLVMACLSHTTSDPIGPSEFVTYFRQAAIAEQHPELEPQPAGPAVAVAFEEQEYAMENDSTADTRWNHVFTVGEDTTFDHCLIGMNLENVAKRMQAAVEPEAFVGHYLSLSAEGEDEAARLRDDGSADEARQLVHPVVLPVCNWTCSSN